MWGNTRWTARGGANRDNTRKTLREQPRKPILRGDEHDHMTIIMTQAEGTCGTGVDNG
jgi:hypothetical protein